MEKWKLPRTRKATQENSPVSEKSATLVIDLQLEELAGRIMRGKASPADYMSYEELVSERLNSFPPEDSYRNSVIREIKDRLNDRRKSA